MLKMLILESKAVRCAAFKKKYSKNYVITFVARSQDAIQKLQQHKFDVIFLDYELDKNDCGMVVAKWIASHPLLHTKIIVHSFNPSQSKRMIELMHKSNAIIMPGAWLI